MTIQSTQLLGINPTTYIQQYLGSELDHILHLSNNLPILININNNLVAIDTLDDYAQAIQTVANYINTNANIIQGAQGSTGIAGPQGAQGSTGAIGTQGAIGSQGATGSQGVIGQNGATGATGSQGVTGTAGDSPHIDGASGNWFLGSTDTGVLATGTNGASGADGVDGVGVIWQPALANTNDLPTLPYSNEQHAFFINATGEAWRYDSIINGWINIGNRKGPTGPQGAQGASGSDGTSGTNGVGSTGSTGSAGADGADGTDGLSSYELWQALDPSNNTLTLAQWLDANSGGIYGEALGAVALLPTSFAKNSAHRDITDGTFDKTYVFHTGTGGHTGDLASTVPGLTGYWRDETPGIFINQNLSAIHTKKVNNTVIGLNSVAIGLGSVATATSSMAIGNGSTCNAVLGTAIGSGAESTHTTGSMGGVSVGGNAITKNGYNVSVGYNVVTNKPNSVSVGHSITNDSSNTIVLATTSTAIPDNSTGISLSTRNANTNDTQQMTESVFVGNYPASSTFRSVIIGSQPTSTDRTQSNATAVGFHSMPTTNRVGYTAIGQNSADEIDGDFQAAFTTGTGTIFKGKANTATPSTDYVKLGVPLTDVSNTKGDTNKMLSADTDGYLKWVTIPTSSTAPVWVSLATYVSGGVGLINAGNPPAYKKVGDNVTIKGAFAINLVSTVLTNLMVSIPSSIRPTSTRVVGVAIDATQTQISPTIIQVIPGGSVQCVFSGKQIVGWDGSNVTNVVDEPTPVQVEFTINYNV